MRLRSLAIAGLLAAIAAVAAPGTPAQAAELFTFKNVNSGLCLTARAGSGERPAVQTTCYGNPDQKWEMRLVSSNRWQIYSPYLGLCLVARGSGETAVVATTCGGWADQLWDWQGLVIPPFGSQYDWFVNANSGNCIAARGAAESRAVATTCGNWADQHWKK